VERSGDEDAHDRVERRQQRLGLAGDERVDQDRVLAVAQGVRRHRRREAVPGDREPPESGGDLVEWGHDAIIAPTPARWRGRDHPRIGVEPALFATS
jgi:hypothetical protein